MKRVIMYILLILAAFMLQNNFFAAVKWIDCIPNLLLILTFVIGLIRGRTEGMIIGFVCGIMLDFFFGSKIGYYAFIYLAIGYLNGITGNLFYVESLTFPVVLAVASDLLFNLYVYFTGFMLQGASGFGYYLRNIILPEMVYTLLLTLLLYKPLCLLNEWMESLEKRSAKKFV